ncbi:hypothetical protein KEG38_27450 [Polyangium jinanense]|uniref:DUF6210 family protein n=1 Tax=Polyangium jinanense TaxID=2829994 RepID=UPI0023423245|nr:DUF6210 family protein [Polyangium jinanense]MDC3957625.1 hypothetical protein [Polyangium jinanense]
MAALIRLYEAGLGVIIQHPSGVLYTNQTCGTCCDHPEVEGVFVPFDAEESWLRLNAHFEGSKYRGTGAMHGIDEEDATFIESILRDGRIGVPLVVDRSRLKDSHEAWVQVLIEGEVEPFPTASGFGPYPRRGVLTWPNSD